MSLNRLRQIGQSYYKFVRKVREATKRSRSPVLARTKRSLAASNTRRRRGRFQLWRKRRSAQANVEQAPSISVDGAFPDFDGTQAAAGRDINLRQQSETVETRARDPAQVASMQTSIGLPSCVLPMPDRLPKAYELVKTLNGDLGHFNTPIHLMRRLSSGKHFIVKQVPLTNKQEWYIEDPLEDPLEDLPEASLLQDLDHENIIAIESVHLDYDGPFCVANIVLQYCDGGDVCDFVASIGASRQQLPVQFVQHFVSSMLDAMVFMHHGETYNAATDEIQHHRHVPVFHRDIKERNIFLDKSNPASNGLPTILLADFGLASTEQMNSGVGGTRGYLAPELICGPLDTTSSASLADGDQVLQGTAGDWYAFGVTLHQVITGKGYVFQAANKSRVDLAASSSCNEEEILQLVLECLKTDPADRPQATDTLRLHRVSAKLKAGLQAWHDAGSRLPEEIWPEAFRFERVEQSGSHSEPVVLSTASEIALRQPALLEAIILPRPYNEAMQIIGSSSHAWLGPKVGLCRRLAVELPYE